LEQAVGVSDGGGFCRAGDLEADTERVRLGLVAGRRLVRDLDEVERLSLEAEGVLVEPGEVEQVLDESLESLGLALESRRLRFAVRSRLR